MIRWSIVVWVAASLGAALAGTYHFQRGTQGPLADEILAYEVTPTQEVTVDIPAGTPLVQLTTWALLSPDGRLLQLEALPYGIELELWSRQTGRRRTRRYGAWSRVAPKSRGQGVVPGFVAWLADGPEWVTDPRTIDVDTTDCIARGGRLRVRALSSEHQHLLARFSYRFDRGDVERRMFERGLDPLRTRRLLNQTTALGFADLSPGARDFVLSFWGRRLTAVGRGQVDYRMRRLLVGRVLEEGAASELRRLEVRLRPGRRAAFNVSRPVTLRAHGPPGSRLSVRDGDDAQSPGWPANRASGVAPVEATISDDGYVDVPLSLRGLRTVTFESDTDGEFFFSVAGDDAQAQVGEVDHIAFPDGRIQVSPDFRMRGHYRLDHQRPVALQADPHQGPFRIRVRAALPDGPTTDASADALAGQASESPMPLSEPWTGRFWVHWIDPDGRPRREGVRVSLWPSLFDSFGDDRIATEGHTAYLFPPKGVRDFALYGDPELAATVAVAEPGVDEATLHAAYRLVLAPDQRFINAPHDIGRWATIEPEQGDLLREADRHIVLRTQVRLVTGPGGVQEPPERIVVPRGHPPRRNLWVHRALADGPSRHEEWFEIGSRATLRVVSDAQEVGQLRLRFHVEPQRLGHPLVISIDGQQRYRSQLVVQSGQVTLAVAPGVRVVQVDGLGERGVVYADAPPKVPMEALREYSVFELAAGSTLDFPITRTSDEPLRLVLFVVTEGTGIPWKLRYEVQAGTGRRRPGVFFREPTEQIGVLEGVSGEREVGLLWQGQTQGPLRASQGRDGVSKTRIRLGDDLTARDQRVRVSLLPEPRFASRVWVRAVLVGQSESPSIDGGRQWTREVADGM